MLYLVVVVVLNPVVVVLNAVVVVLVAVVLLQFTYKADQDCQIDPKGPCHKTLNPRVLGPSGRQIKHNGHVTEPSFWGPDNLRRVWGTFWSQYKGEGPQNSAGNYLGPYVTQ